jgi:copper chaperone NosL
MKYLYILLIPILFISCNAQPDPIDYGHDDCSYCKMTIVDKAHSAQLVTKKGKQYKYDAIECMVRNVLAVPELSVKSKMYVANYKNPGKIIDAKKASYIISPKIKSPMGANLSAVHDVKEANNLVKINGGNTYTWKTLLEYLNE